MLEMPYADKLIAEGKKSQDPLARDLANYLNLAILHIKAYGEDYLAYYQLKKAGLKFKGYEDTDRGYTGDITIYARLSTYNELIENAKNSVIRKYLDRLFGGNE